MTKFEYDAVETRSVDVPGCPLCGSEDLKFWNCNRDDVRSASAYVRCKNCGHEVKADGYKLHLDWGVDCQLEAIREWKSQASMYGHKPVFTEEFIAEKDKFKKLPKMMDCPYHHCLPDYAQRPLGYTVEHIFYCAKCKENNPTPRKFNAFGYGFTSQYTKSAALANWNKGVHRRQMRMMKEAIMHGV